MNEEIELKLAIGAGDIARLRRRSVLSAARPTRTVLEATYFDTPDLRLRSRGMGLRLRRENERWLQTLKAGPTGAALAARSEWESPARLVRGRARIDLTALRGSPLPRLLARHGGVAALRPVFRTRVVRTAWLLHYRGATIEVALDVGELRAGTGRRARVEPIREVELELKGGAPARLLELALALIGPERDPIALLPLARSKAERGYALATGQAGEAAKASAARLRAGIVPAMSTAEALRAVIANGLEVVIANAEAARRAYAPELIHQTRVALRRMRSAARLFDRRQRDLGPRRVDDLRALAQSIGPARDADVLVDATLPAWRAAERDASAAVQRFLAARRAERDAARVAARAALSSPGFARAVLHLLSWSRSEAPQGPGLQKFAPRALRQARRRLFEAALFLTALSPQKRHRVRILAKRLRYAVDLLGADPPDPTAAVFARHLAELQDELGALNDLAVAEARVSAIARVPQIAASIRSWKAAREPALLLAAEQRLVELERTPSVQVRFSAGGRRGSPARAFRAP